MIPTEKEYISVAQWAKQNGVSERTARNYCANGKIEGAFLIGKTWNVPATAPVPQRKRKIKLSTLLEILKSEMENRRKGGIYHRIQIDLTYNSNHIEGSRLSEEQTRLIFDTNTLGVSETSINVDDVIETSNHFRAIDYIVEHAEARLTEPFIKQLHAILKTGTSDSAKKWAKVGHYKTLPNEVGGNMTTPPEEVTEEMRSLLKEYNSIKTPSFEDIIDFHWRFERIHPFYDGNGRVGRLIMFHECLRLGIVPFIITDNLKMFYYRGLQNWPRLKGYLLDTCLTAQDEFKKIMQYFRIPY